MDEVVDARGTKRTCQSAQCGARFYDLNRDPIICPICDTPYMIASAPPKREAAAAAVAAPVVEKAKPEETSEDKADEGVELVSLEDAEVNVDDDGDDATFLEEEADDDNGDVAVIVTNDEDDET